MRVNLLVFLAVAAACRRAPASELSLVDHSRPATTLAQTPVADIPAVVAATYRVRPDRRFLLAAADVVELTTGHRPAEVSIELAKDHWRVRIDGNEAGELPDLASFDDGLAMLRHLADAAHRPTLTLTGKDASRAMEKVNPAQDLRAQFEALQIIGNANDARATNLAARALVFVNMRTSDPYDTADALRARALALVAMARNVDQEAAVLARIFGYERDALARAAKASLVSRTPELVWEPADAGTPSTVLPNVAMLASPLAGEAVVRTHYEAMFTAAVKAVFDEAFERLDSEPAARDVVDSLGPQRSPLLAQFTQALKTKILTKYTPSRVKADDCVSADRLGARFRAQLLRDLMTAASGSHDIRRAADTIFPQLDSRPEALLAAANLAMGLGDISRYDSFFKAAVASAPSAANVGEIAWHSRNVGDREHLRQLLENPQTRPHDRMLALSALAELGEDDVTIVDRFEHILAENKYEGYPTYAAYLNDHHAWATKERAAKRWLDDHRGEHTIEAAYFASSEADALEHLGRYDEAWKLIKDRVSIGSYNVISTAMSLQQRLDHSLVADQYGRSLVERYHGNDAYADYAAVLWREKRWNDAAALIGQHQRSKQLSSAFRETLEDVSAADVQAAIAAMDKGGVDPNAIDDCVGALQTAGRNELVPAAANTYLDAHPLQGNGPVQASIAIYGWRALRSTKGPAPAMDWLRLRIPAASYIQLVTIAYQMQAYELVAEFATPQSKAEKSIEMTFYRAAALTAMRVPRSDPRWDEVARIAATEGSPPESLHPITQYLLGETDEAHFLAIGKYGEWHTSVSYFIALHALVGGDYERALPLMLSAAEGPEEVPPTAWAIETLNRWANARKTWGQIAAAGQM